MAVDPNIKKKADDIRNKIYGKEVRESLASGLEAMSTDVVENEGRQSVVEGRQDSVESQWQAVSDEMTDKDVISAPEIIAARNGEANLKTRIDKDHQEVTAQLAQTTKKVNDLGINISDLGVKDGDDITDELESLLDENVHIIIPEGTFYWSRPITTDKVVKLSGVGKEETTLIYRPIPPYDLEQHAFNIAVPSTDTRNIAEIEELTFRDESINSLSLMKIARIHESNNERWGARVYINKVDYYDYRNKGLIVVAPYEAVFEYMKFKSSEPFVSGYHQTPANNSVGLTLTGIGRGLSIMGNVILITGCSFHNHRFGVDMVNCRGVVFEDTVFEHNWISVYLHSKNEAKWSTRNVQFNNCWFEDTGSGHPKYYVVDCFIDEATGNVTTDKERARQISVNNTIFYSELGKSNGFPASETHTNYGGTYSRENATESNFIRQWDTKEEMNGFVNNDGVITNIGGKDNYFRGKITSPGGFQKNLTTTGKHVVDMDYAYENLEYRQFGADSDTHVYSVDLRTFNIPEITSSHHLASVFLNSQITLMVKSADDLELRLELEYSGRPLSAVDSDNYNDFKTKYPNTKQYNLKYVDESNEDPNNNKGVKLSRDGYNLKFEFNISGLKGGRIFFENKYIMYRATHEM